MSLINDRIVNRNVKYYNEINTHIAAKSYLSQNLNMNRSKKCE